MLNIRICAEKNKDLFKPDILYLMFKIIWIWYYEVYLIRVMVCVAEINENKNWNIMITLKINANEIVCLFPQACLNLYKVGLTSLIQSPPLYY